jgi:4-amino-4-deoxy-L-arabinose transferase-like glycosyltransferase
MRLLASSPTVGAQHTVQPHSSPLATVWLLRTLSDFVDIHAWLVFAAVSSACGWIRLNGFGSRPLDHDELYTFYIAQAPTLRQLIDLTRTIDLHPPLSYLLTRLCFSLFGISAWSCRLPSVLAFLIATASLFWLVKHILSPLYGIIAVLLLWSVPFAYQADQARPYSLLLCFTTIMLVGWYRAIETVECGAPPYDRRWALLTLIIGGFGLLLSHVLGILPYAAFLGAESIRYLIRRRVDERLWAVLIAPAIAALTYVPLIHNRSVVLFTGDYRATPMRMIGFYSSSIRYLPIPLALVALLAAFGPALMRPDKATVEHAQPLKSVVWPLGFLLACFTLIPLGVGIIFARSGTAFFDRYGVIILIPIALVPPIVLAYRTRRNQIAAILLALILGAILFLNSVGKPWLIEQIATFAPPHMARYVIAAFALPPLIEERAKPAVPDRLQKAFEAARPVTDLDAVEPDLPLVANTGLTFLEIDRQGDGKLTHRLYLLGDKQSATTIAHDTVFENYDHLNRSFPIRGTVEPYCTFIRKHPHFLVLGAYSHPQGWLLKKLDKDGADLRIIGTYSGITEEAQLYEVAVTNTSCTTEP